MEDTVNWATYLRAIAGDDSGARISQRTGVPESTVSRWLSGQIPARVPRQVVDVAKAYGVSAIQALIAAGYIDQVDIDLAAEQPRALQLRDFTELELAQEMVRRVAEGPVPLFDAPLDENHPAMKDLQ